MGQPVKKADLKRIGIHYDFEKNVLHLPVLPEELKIKNPTQCPTCKNNPKTQTTYTRTIKTRVRETKINNSFKNSVNTRWRDSLAVQQCLSIALRNLLKYKLIIKGLKMVVTLSKNEFLNKINKKNGLVQIATLLDTKLTPSKIYAILKSHDSTGYSYLLESVEKEKRHARFSFVGASPLAVITIKNRKLVIDFFIETALIDDVKSSVGQVCEKITCSNNTIIGDIADGYDVFDALRAAILIDKIIHEDMVFFRQVFSGGAIGFVAYDCVYDSHIDLQPFDSETPDAQFVLTKKTILFDHLTKKTYLIFTEHITEDSNLKAIYENIVSEGSNIEHLLSKTQTIPESVSQHSVHVVGCTADRMVFEQMVERAKQHIIDGDILQVVPSRRCELETQKSAYQLYQQLRKVNPSPYMYLFEFEDTAIIGASPETLLSVHDRKVVTNPIAGTCPRGSTPEEDRIFAQQMLSSEKERAEHVMLVDLGRNDVRAVCKSGSVIVEDFMSVLKYSHVQHIESTVTGELREECDAFDATREIFPAGTLSGAPKIRAMEIIHELEGISRGIYGGGAGYYCFNGDADFAIVIRTMIQQGSRVHVQAGAGIVADSDPEYEYNETERKMAAMMQTVIGDST